MLFKIFLFSFLMLVLESKAQWKPTDHINEKAKFARFNIAGLLDPMETNFSTGLEYSLAKKWSTSLDLGYIFYSSYYDAINNTSGILIRPAVRYYIDKTGRTFIEMELHYKNVRYTINDWLGKNIVNGTPSYFEFQEFKISKIAYGAHTKIGYKARISKNYKYWLETYLGLGIRSKKEKVIDVANSSYNPRNTFRFQNNETQNIFMFTPFGFRLLYRF